MPSELVPALSRAIETIAATVDQHREQREQQQCHALDRNADQRGRIGIAAHREHVAPETRPMHEEREHAATPAQISTGIGIPCGSAFDVIW